jgi:hypothetical protein
MRFEADSRGAEPDIVGSDAEPHYREALQELGFQPDGEAFRLTYPRDGSHFETVAKNWARLGEEMVRQLAERSAVPWDKALEAFLDRVEGRGVSWFLLGSAALAVRGVEVSPGDIDISTDRDGAFALQELFLDHLVWPTSDTRGWPVCAWFGRAYFHSRIEWAAEVREDVDRDYPRPWGPAGQKRLETVEWRGHTLRVTPLDLQLDDERLRGRHEHVEAIRRLREKGR